MFRVLIFTIAIYLSSACTEALAQEIFRIADYTVDVGSRNDLRVNVPEGQNDSATFIPITVINGAKKGPTVLMVAGVHGYEYAPILAAGSLAESIDPQALAGRLIIVRVAHISSFEARTPFVNPYDRKNLNRSFPGNPKGTQTERIAYTLSSAIIPKADIVFDVHSGDGSEWLEAFVGVYGGPLATDYPKALSLAKSFGFPNIIRYSMETQAQIDRGRSLNRQAVAQGLPTLLIEIGENGRRDHEHVQAIVQGIKNALIKLSMLKGEIEKSADETRYFDGTSSVKATQSGIWYPVSVSSRFVEKGDKIGVIKNYDGKLAEAIVSPTAGYTIYGHAGPPVIKGASVVTIAHPIDEL